MRLLCFPFAGAGASLYRSWIDALAPKIEVRPIQLPGRESRWGEPLITRIEPLIQELVRDLKSDFDGPFSLFGHSMGAFIAFELGRQLRRDGQPLPEMLIVSGARAPHMPEIHPALHAKPDTELLSGVQRLNLLPSSMLANRDLLSLQLPVLRADLTLYETYSYRAEPPLNCKVSAYGGVKDSNVPRHFLARWRDQTTADFSIRMFPGDHSFVRSAQRALLRVISNEF